MTSDLEAERNRLLAEHRDLEAEHARLVKHPSDRAAHMIHLFHDHTARLRSFLARIANKPLKSST